VGQTVDAVTGTRLWASLVLRSTTMLSPTMVEWLFVDRLVNLAARLQTMQQDSSEFTAKRNPSKPGAACLNRTVKCH